MTPHKKPDEDVAATDAVFEELAAQPDEQLGAGTDPAPSVPPETSASSAGEAEPPPVGDYVRELQDEFKEQEDEATL